MAGLRAGAVVQATHRRILLSGEHSTLPEAELKALLAVHAPVARVVLYREGLVADVAGGTAKEVDSALTRMALAHAWMEPWGRFDASKEGLEAAASIVQEHTDGRGSVAVHSLRRAGDARGGPEAVSRSGIERRLGSALAAAGHPIDLQDPDWVLDVWVVGQTLHVGRRMGVVDRSRFERRVLEERDHFSPVSMHPRRAASLLHLARVPPGGVVLDPFCGTGGMVLEAALDGYQVWGSDLDAWMVQGCLSTLADAGPEPVDGSVFVADVGDVPGLLPVISGGVVTDLPYGRASTTNREDLMALYRRAFQAMREVLAPGGLAVVGLADPSLLVAATDAGGTVMETHEERVHRSLTRTYAVVKWVR